MERVPLTILSGFLGAGKTTLLKRLLSQAHQRQLDVSVVVNDMSDLDVDGVLIANTDIVSRARHSFVTLSADSISSESGIRRLDATLDELLTHKVPAHILLETSGSSHPLPLVTYLRGHPQVALRGLLTLVDGVMLQSDFEAGRSLLPRWQHNLRNGRRGIENLLAEQILFCSHLLLTKSDRLPAAELTAMAQNLQQINPLVSVMAVSRGNLCLDDLLAMPAYDFHRVARLVEELDSEVAAAGAHDIEFRVIEDDRPFHPQRLWDICHRFLGTGIHRSKGFFWLPGRDDLALLWNQAAGSISLDVVSFWKAGVLAHPDPGLTREECDLLRQQMHQQWPGRFGDRRCRLTVIGQRREVDPFADALRGCFLTETEIAHWRAGGQFPDPWPVRMAKLEG